MSLKLMYITNNPRVAEIAERHGVNSIWVDLETIGKEKRQRGMNSVLSNHSMEDISHIRKAISQSNLLVRINPINSNSKYEIDEVIDRGCDEIMLPYYKSTDEVKQFVDLVDGRAKTILLLETIEAEQCIDETLKNNSVDYVHIGLNDLHIQYNSSFMFELLSNGKVEEICNRIKTYKVPFGFGGIARLDEGMLPARHIIGEHYRLGSQMVILSRSFYDSWLSNDYEEIERVFKYGIKEIREYEARLQGESVSFFESNKELVEKEVQAVLDKKK